MEFTGEEREPSTPRTTGRSAALRGGALLLPVVLAAGAAGAGWASNRDDARALRWVDAAPRATLAAPRGDGPARYAGVVVGPELRTPGGARAVMFSYWLERDDGEGTLSWCRRDSREPLRLRDGDREAPLTLLDRLADSAHYADDRPETRGAVRIEHGGDRMIARPSAPPAERSTCVARIESGAYFEYSAPPASRAEVIACHRGGRLLACERAPVGGMFAVGSVRLHRERLAARIRRRTRVGRVIALALIAALGIVVSVIGPRGLRAWMGRGAFAP